MYSHKPIQGIHSFCSIPVLNILKKIKIRLKNVYFQKTYLGKCFIQTNGNKHYRVCEQVSRRIWNKLIYSTHVSFFHLAIIHISPSFSPSLTHTFTCHLFFPLLFITACASVAHVPLPFIAAPSHRVTIISPDIWRRRAVARKRDRLNKWLCWRRGAWSGCLDKECAGRKRARRIDEVSGSGR